jgi:quercetin dioxygenase-like cupin family protein
MSNHVPSGTAVRRTGVVGSVTKMEDENLIDFAAKKRLASITTAKRLYVMRHIYEPGGTHVPHEHDDTEQAYIVISGTARAIVGEETLDLAAGDVVYIPPNTNHEVVATGDEPYEVMLIGVKLDEEDLK